MSSSQNERGRAGRRGEALGVGGGGGLENHRKTPGL